MKGDSIGLRVAHGQADEADQISVGDSVERAQNLAELRGNWPGLRLRRSDTFIVTLGVLLLTLILIAVAAPLLPLADPNLGGLRDGRIPPVFNGGSWEHPLGTDQIGRDVLSRIIFGARVSLLVGFVSMAWAGVLGCAIGLVAGYYGGVVDAVLMRIADIQLSIPILLLAISVIAALGPSLTNIIFVLGITGWVLYARVVRGDVLKNREEQFVLAARCLGARDGRILIRHILPNIAPPIIIIATFTVAQMIIIEAALSFLGLGVQPPTPSWGGMLAEGRQEMATMWWLATFPGLAILFTVLVINLMGDWLRERLDPRLWQQR